MGRAFPILLLFGACALRAQTPPPYPSPGKLVDVGGYRVHLHCTGEGGPTVMIVGAGFSFDWDAVQSGVEKFTRICTWDPPGTAWSDHAETDPGRGAGSQQRVDEINSLFRAAGIDGPFVLVGLSTGALVARLYAAEHRDEVGGMVIVDHAFLPPVLLPRKPVASAEVDTPPVLLSTTPIVLTPEDDPGFGNLPERIQQMHRWADSLNPALQTAAIAEECMREVEAAAPGAHPLGDIPLVVISTANDSPGYAELQRELLLLSVNSKQVVASKSFHSVEMSEPGVVTEAIRDVSVRVKSKRRTAVPDTMR